MVNNDACCLWFITVLLLGLTAILTTMGAFSIIGGDNISSITNTTVDLEPARVMLLTSFVVYETGAFFSLIFCFVTLYHASKDTIDLVYEEAVSRVQQEMSPSAETVGDDTEVKLEDSVECGCKV